MGLWGGWWAEGGRKGQAFEQNAGIYTSKQWLTNSFKEAHISEKKQLGKEKS